MKRKTRATNMDKDDEDVCQIDPPRKKRCVSKNKGVKKPLLHEQTTENTAGNEPTLRPIPLDQHNNINDENTPPPLIIDTDKEASSSQPIMSDYFSRKEPIGERLPRCTSNTTNKTQNSLSNNPAHCVSNENQPVVSDRSNKERSSENYLTPVINRSTNDQYASSIRSQSSTPAIVVSVDRRQRDSNDDMNHHHRTSTPIRPTRNHQSNTELVNDYNDSFSVDSIPRETYNMLSRFPEFRRLLKAFQTEKKKCETWSKDFNRLQNNYNQLEANSFPRPPPVALSYLVDMVARIQQSSGRGDPRTDEQIARDLDLRPIFLMSLKDISPQQSALNLFNHLYPGYENKVTLGSVNNLEASKPGLFNTILVFAQRSSPGTNYKIQELRDALNNSIRGARHHWRRVNGLLPHEAAPLGNGNVDHVEIQDENGFGRNDNYAEGNANMDVNEREIERRFDVDECF